jgi:murein DD-endopeptidase MepM/ murein hydrolase activator NlpD
MEGPIESVELSPLYRRPFSCSEHFYGQLGYVGDALGQDCLIIGGIVNDQGYPRPFRTDGRTNEDWYGWGEDVLAPFDGVVESTHANPVTNAPGMLGRPPSGSITVKRADGTIVLYAHLAEISVKPGDSVKAGQAVAKVGNNGFSRSPHVHVGAYRGDLALQIRWDLKAMRRLQTGK